jgi:hypothetical protein
MRTREGFLRARKADSGESAPSHFLRLAQGWQPFIALSSSTSLTRRLDVFTISDALFERTEISHIFVASQHFTVFRHHRRSSDIPGR